jgi:FkbM family methyltransferase
MFDKFAVAERHMQLYGLWRGLGAYVQPRMKATGLVAVHPFGRAHPIYLRRGTSDLAVFQQVFVDREYRLNWFPQWDSVLRHAERIATSGKRPIVLDAGGNIGLAAIYFARELPMATVVTVEPEGNNFELLKKNVAPYSNIEAVQVALLDHACEVTITNPDAPSWAFRVEERGGDGDRGKTTVPAQTVDAICSAIPDGELLVAKIDIEGAEQRLFSSSTEWATRAGVLIVELHDWMLPWEAVSSPFLSLISQGDFDLVIRGENTVAFNRSILTREPSLTQASSVSSPNGSAAHSA